MVEENAARKSEAVIGGGSLGGRSASGQKVTRSSGSRQEQRPSNPLRSQPRLVKEMFPGFPAGTRFAASLSATTEGVDGTTPLIEKNTNHEVEEGVYFPPNAELAYANRAGVQGGAGTVALWVEPVDWIGRDAHVRSFFRINDPASGDYRFHLLKDAANLRFQFITEQGENNLWVPIDWWASGEPHHVAVTWGSSVLRVYVDGVPMSEQPYEGTLAVPASAPGWWGSNNAAGTPGAGAILNDAFVADRPLDNAEMLRLWEADGARAGR